MNRNMLIGVVAAVIVAAGAYFVFAPGGKAPMEAPKTAQPAAPAAQQQAAAPAPAPAAAPAPAPSVAAVTPGANDQFIAGLVYRTGAYAPNGVPFANGVADYYSLVNERDGGVNGVKIQYEECETGYATDRGVECYERLKNKGPTGTAYINPLSTGITFALTEKAPIDKIPVISMGYGRSESRDGSVFQWNFPLLGTYWSAADLIIQHIGKINGGMDKLKDKNIVLVYHDSPYGKEPIPLLNKRAEMHGFKFTAMPVTHPGVEQKATWLQIRQGRPDYVLLWGWGVMNSTSIKEAAAVGYPRENMFGVWWSGAEPDVLPAEGGATGYSAVTLQHGAGRFPVHADIKKHLYDKNKGSTKWEDTDDVLYNRGLINAMLGVEAMRTAMKKYGNKPVTGEQTRWGLENLDLTAARLKELGLEGAMQPIKISCNDHEGARTGRIHTWDGKEWKFSSDWYTADDAVIAPMVKQAAATYAKEKNITPVACN